MKYKPFVYTVFFASGISGLMYEVVWLRMLARVTGVTIYATATVLAAFMAGLALGSFLLGRFIDRRQDALRIYAGLELLVAVAALLLPVIFAVSVPLYRYVYYLSGENLLITSVVRAVVSFFSVLIPTTVMGGTLPVLTSFLVKRDRVFGKHFSTLYGLNTLGAVVGVLLSGFVTIGSLGELHTVYIGVAINVLVAVAAYLMYLKDRESRTLSTRPAHVPAAEMERISPYGDSVRKTVLVAFAISGFTSLAYEVIWTRQLILFLETSIYAFSGMLAIYLYGIALGSMCSHRLMGRLKSPVVAFALLELAVGALSLINLRLFYPLDSPSARMFFGSALPMVAALVIVFPLTFVLGLVFPVAASCYAESVETTGSSVGRLYGCNTVGSILGSLAAGFVLIPLWGSTHTVVFLACLNIGLAFVLFMLEPSRSLVQRVSFVFALLVCAVLVVGSMGRDPFLGTVERRISGTDNFADAKLDLMARGTEIHSNREGLEGTVTAFSIGHDKQLWINGMGMTRLCTETKLMAHLPLMFTKDAKELLVICFGMGTTVKSAAAYPGLNITAVELVSECFEDFTYFHPGSRDLLKKGNIKLMTNDGRNYLLFTSRKYDVISVDPAPPVWSAGTVNLYTKEFFALCKAHLNPDGAMCLWFPGGTRAENLAIIRTFSEVFPEFSIWAGPRGWGFYCIGTLRDVPWSEFTHNMEKAFANAAIQKDLSEYDGICERPDQLVKLKILDKHMDRETVAQGIVVTDDYPYTEFFLWRRLLANP
jgi:spermidine synthase